MPTKYKDYPIYTYDEPSSHSDFTGGINLGPSNEHLLDNEMRDCVNMTYLSGALVKRKGAEILSRVVCDEDLTNIQGIFLYTFKLTYLIIAANGKLYYGVFNEDIDIQLERLYIYQQIEQADNLYNPLDTLAGIEEYTQGLSSKHNGYKQVYYSNPTLGKSYLSNVRGKYEDISGGIFNIGDIVTHTVGLINRRFLCIEAFEKIIINPSNTLYWELYTKSTNTSKPFDESKIEYHLNDIVLYNNDNYICINTYYNYKQLPTKDNVEGTTLTHKFICVDADSETNWSKKTSLIFQNYRDIECASINNKLIVATGTRLCEIYPEDNLLKAKPIVPYLINNSELINIGFNYLSPYPEQCITNQINTITTQLHAVKIEKQVGGMFKLTPIVSISQGDSINEYKFKWEKLINDTWYTIITFKSQFAKYIEADTGNLVTQKESTQAMSITVTDADKYLYRVTMAKNFDYPNDYPDARPFSSTRDYKQNEVIIESNIYYRCLQTYNHKDFYYLNDTFNIVARQIVDGQLTETYRVLWEVLYKTENVLILDTQDEKVFYPDKFPKYWEATKLDIDRQADWSDGFNSKYTSGNLVKFNKVVYKCLKDHTARIKTTSYISDFDYIVNKTLEVENNQASSVLFNKELNIEDTFLTINSCTKILADGYKLLLYDDLYNSGMWFKSIISNPYYITDRGSLSFKTLKNESVIKVIPFQGNLIVFANSDNAGGSIHLVKGNGDDYNAQDGYYSPYQRKTINASISCDNPKTVQVCDNILVFKYFNRIYYINASDLDNDTVKVNPCNDKLLSSSKDVQIPWEDKDCISIVTNDYYALIWKEKYYIDNNGDLILEHPGIRVKMYYKLSNQQKNGLYYSPWLRDESEYFNVDYIVYYKGNPLYLYRNLLLNFNGKSYDDLDKPFECKIKLKGYQLEYPNMIKLLQNVSVYYHRDQSSNVDFKIEVRNEAGHILISKDDNKKSSQELRVLFANKEKHKVDSIRLDSTIQDIKQVNASYAFPCLLAEACITANNRGIFSLSNVVFNYTTCEQADQTQFDLYNKIIRPQDTKDLYIRKENFDKESTFKL